MVDSDEDRNGMAFIYEEETIAGELIDAMTLWQKSVAYADGKLPENMLGETYCDTFWASDEGIYISKLTPNLLSQYNQLITSYLGYFTKEYISIRGDNLFSADTKYWYMGNTAYNGAHYYRIKNNHDMIECENYGGHTHHLWRSVNDFGAWKSH